MNRTAPASSSRALLAACLALSASLAPGACRREGSLPPLTEVAAAGDPPAAPTGPPETLTFSVLRPDGDPSLLPYLVGLNRGYFKDAGVDLKRVDDGTESDLYLLGRLQLHIRESTAAGKLKLLAACGEDSTHPFGAIVRRSELGLVTQTLLRQYPKVPILGAGWGAAPVIRAALRENGLINDASEIVLVSEDEFRSLPWGVAFLTEPYLSTYTRSGAVQPFITGPLFAERVFEPWITAVVAVRSDVASGRAPLIARATAAFDRSIEFMNHEPEKAAEILATYAADRLQVKEIAPMPLKCFASTELPMTVIGRQTAWLHREGLTPVPDYTTALPLTPQPPKRVEPPRP